MIPMRQSGAAEQNAMLQPQPAAGGPPPGAAAAAAPPGTGRRRRPQGNQAWLREVRREHRLGEPGDVVLIGGTSVADFRVRIAQAHARHDLTPSYWSLVGLIRDRDELLTATLEGWEDAAAIPATNAIVTLPVARFDDPERYPNIAVLRSRARRRTSSMRPIASRPNGARPICRRSSSTGLASSGAPRAAATRCSRGRACPAPSWSSWRSGSSTSR
jgi:hypothetical protein